MSKMPPTLPSAVVCGSQTIPPSQDILSRLRFHLTQDPDLEALAEAVYELPDLLSRLVEDNSLLNRIPSELPASLKHWISNSEFVLNIPATLPNVLLAPLTVIIHVVQYIQYLKQFVSDDPHAHIRESVRHGGFQGLCTGFLSATALACSKTKRDIARNAAVAMRLAMCIGAYVDLDQTTTGDESTTVACFVVQWGPGCPREEVEQILKHYPDAYISVELDEKRATITVPETDLLSLRGILASKGIKLAKVQLNGRYHNKKHGGSLDQLLRLCLSEPSLRFAPNSGPLGPLRNNTTGRPLTSEDQLHEVCLRCLLVEPANWYSTMSHAVAPFTRATPKESTVLELSLVSCIPRSLATSPLVQVIPASLPTTVPLCKQPQYDYPENSIAIVGAACKYPGADSFEQLWDLIDAGVSMNGKLSDNRFNPKGTWRGAPQDGGFMGNFVTGIDRFDRTLFGISPREATYMDPQQRIALQVAYQAIETSGYFGQGSPTKDVGCYLGVASSDYEGNVNTHAPTAFSFTGTARAFVSGRISHYFKWTGPSITVDTACSSSAMAIHQACRGIASGDCKMALAGGINIISGPHTHQNLAAGNFLNTTGPCRSFDSGANGYCRSEGCGFIVLKTLSSAMADGDNILGVIAATATNQSDGSSSIAVPVSRSQTELYQRVLSQAAMSPNRVSYVEAHGTGTPRGDPIEYESISDVFSGDEDNESKARKVHLGTIKTNIGHAEAASGVASILKVLLMMQQGRIPPQANFSNLNPAMQPGRIEIATKSRDWDVDFRAACVNNFGASGNNTAVILCQPPKSEPSIRKETPSLHSYPFLLSAQSTASLEGYTTALRHFVNTRTPSLPDLAYNLAQKQNRTLRHRANFHAGSVEELKSQLNDNCSLLANASPSTGLGERVKPVVLVFGGQTGSTVHLSKEAYDASSLLRTHVDRCDVVLQEMGLPSVFPVIFSQEPIQDVVLLHSLLFSVQYACAMAWIDSGVPVQRVVGHSFGHFTAMCVSGVVTLPGALKLVAGRATLMKEQWGGDKGHMLVAEVDREGAHSLTRSSNATLEIACCNGPYSHVFVGKEPAIQALESHLSGVKTRRLNTTHGFHSEMVECIMDRFSELTKSVKYTTPTIPIETCSETSSWERFTPELVADHSRKTVYFHDAIKRIEQQLGSCVWLDGGSGSIGSVLAKIALRGSDLSKHSFLGLQLGSSDPLGSLVDTTRQLWNDGVPVQFWLYHPNEKSLYSSSPVPGYQFNETSHWVPFVEREEKNCSADTEEALISLANLPSPEPHASNFVVNQAHPDWEAFIKGREVLGGALCPLSVYIELAVRAASLLVPGLPPMFRCVSVDNLEIQIPLGRKAVPGLTLKLEQQKPWTWEFVLESDSGEKPARHAAGTVIVTDRRTPETRREELVQGLIEYSHCHNLLHDEATLSIQGNLVYKLLQKVADYDGAYKGIRSVAIKDDEAVAHVEMPPAARHYVGHTSCNPPLVDQFVLVAEIHALSMENCKRSEVFVCAGLGEVDTFESFQSQTGGPWAIYTRQSPGNDHREIICDTLVFDTATRRLVASVTGARFVKTSILALQRVIERANTDQFITEQDRALELRPLCSDDTSATSSPGSQQASEIWSTTAQLVHDLTGFPPEQLSSSTPLADIGLDSLATTELESKIKDVFRVDLPIHPSDRHREFGSLYDDIRAHGASSRLGQVVITPDSSESSSSSSVPDREGDQTTSNTMDRLMGLIAEHIGEADSVLLPPGTELRSLGLDSLLALELESELLETFGVRVDIMHLDPAFTINDLHDLFFKSRQRHTPPEADARPANFVDEAAVRFVGTRAEASACAQEAGFAGFYDRVYPKQMNLVLAYVVEAFAALGCDLRTILPEHRVPAVPHQSKHGKVVAYYYNLLQETGLITQTSEGLVRTSMPIDLPESTALHNEVVGQFAQHRSEHTLLQRTGARLADCLSGKADALQLLFRDKSTGDLLQDVYTNSPMFKTGTLLLGRFLTQQALTGNTSPGGTDGVFRILELGAGTGGTTKYLLDQLVASGINFRYTFTDISPALIARARKTFAMYDCLEYMTLDVEQPAPPHLTQSFDLIISSNCVHATKDLGRSCKCTFDLLRPKGMLCLLELTRDLPWLDCTFGLLDGWWRFEDGRQHVLANEKLWKGVLEGTGFGYVDWSDDETRESDVFRLIMALKS